MTRLAHLTITAIILLSLPAMLHAGQCNITATPLNFGIYDTLDPVPVTSTATLSIACKNPSKIAVMVTVQLSSGNSGNFTQRNLASTNGDLLLYNVYTDATLSTIFGDDSSGSSGSPSRMVDKFTPWDITLYAQLIPLQNVPVGLYSDTLTATILW